MKRIVALAIGSALFLAACAGNDASGGAGPAGTPFSAVGPDESVTTAASQPSGSPETAEATGTATSAPADSSPAGQADTPATSASQPPPTSATTTAEPETSAARTSVYFIHTDW